MTDMEQNNRNRVTDNIDAALARADNPDTTGGIGNALKNATLNNTGNALSLAGGTAAALTAGAAGLSWASIQTGLSTAAAFTVNTIAPAVGTFLSGTLFPLIPTIAVGVAAFGVIRMLSGSRGKNGYGAQAVNMLKGSMTKNANIMADSTVGAIHEPERAKLRKLVYKNEAADDALKHLQREVESRIKKTLGDEKKNKPNIDEDDLDKLSEFEEAEERVTDKCWGECIKKINGRSPNAQALINLVTTDTDGTRILNIDINSLVNNEIRTFRREIKKVYKDHTPPEKKEEAPDAEKKEEASEPAATS